MHPKVSKKLFLAIVAFAHLLGSVAFAERGGNHGGGGSGHEIEFKMIGFAIVNAMEDAGLREAEGVSVEDLRRTLQGAIVDSTFSNLHRRINGRLKRVDALNFPSEQRIVLSIPGWTRLRTRELKERLVLHEAVSLLGLERDSDEKSSRIFNRLRALSQGERRALCTFEGPSLERVGDLCLRELYQEAELRDLRPTEEELLAIIDRRAAELGEEGPRMREMVLRVRRNFPAWIEMECGLEALVLPGSTMGTYVRASCELDVLQRRTKSLRKAIRMLKGD